MTKDEILQTTRPEDLFPFDEDAAKAVYRQLSLRWHPDRGGDTTVFSSITEKWGQRAKKITTGTWEGAATIELIASDGYLYTLQTRTSKPFHLGMMHVCDDAVWFVMDALHIKFFDNYKKDFYFATPEMQTEFRRYLPNVLTITRLEDSRLAMKVAKTPDVILLRDVMQRHMLDVKHIAWIVSRLMNQVCYLSYTGFVHHDISPDTVFISPPHHTTLLLGGWWYSEMVGERISIIPKRTFDVMPFSAKVRKIAAPGTDLELVRLCGREMLAGRTAPEPMHKFLHRVGSGSARQQFTEWMEVLQQSFGPRRFMPLSISADDIYAPLSKAGV